MNKKSGKTITTLGLKAVLLAIASKKGNVEAILEDSGISKECIDDVEGRVSEEQLMLFWKAASKELKDSNIALKMSSLVPFGTYQTLDYLLSTSMNIKVGLNRFSKYYSIINQKIEIKTEVEGDLFKINFDEVKEVETNIDNLEFEMGSLLNRLKSVTNQKIELVSVSFTHRCPTNVKFYENFFRCEVLFERPQSSLVFSKEVLKFSCNERDSHLAELMERNAVTWLSILPGSQEKVAPFIKEFETYLIENLHDGHLGIEYAAKKFGMSTRTFQRKLKEYNLSYSETLLKVRKELSIKLLRDESLSLAEIAFLSGFSEPSAFHRAFKKWMDMTPLQFRKSA